MKDVNHESPSIADCGCSMWNKEANQTLQGTANRELDVTREQSWVGQRDPTN